MKRLHRFPAHGLRAATLASILLLNLGMRMSLALRPIGFIDARTLPDDAYLSLTIARNIARGEGPSYAGEFTNGFQPMSVYLLAPVFLLNGDDPTTGVRAATVLSSLFDTLTLFVICRMIIRRCRSPLALFPAALAWMLSPAGLRTAVNGMETSMACFIFACCLMALDRLVSSRPLADRDRSWFLLGALTGAGMFARIDLAGFALTAVATIFVLFRQDLRRAIALALVFAAGVAIIECPWLAYGYAHTGELLPVSASAIRLMSLATVEFSPSFSTWYRLMLREGTAALWADGRAMLIAAAAFSLLAVVTGVASPRRIVRVCAWLAPASLCAALLFVAYTCFVFGPWFFDRYLFPACVVLTLIVAATCDVLLEAAGRRLIRGGALIAVALLIATVDVTDPALGRTILPSVRPPGGYLPIGIWARRRFPPGSVIASAQSGAIGYFADSLTVINLDGVVSPSCYRALREFRAMEYLRRRKAHYVVGWYSNFQYLEHQSAGIERLDLGPLRPIEGFRTLGYEWFFAEVRYDIPEEMR